MSRAPQILLIDNYDSFVHNLSHHLRWLGAEVTVARNDAISPLETERLTPDGIVLSPGPGRPADAGVSEDLVHLALRLETPLLGVCLGLQAIVTALGGTVEKGPEPVHGKQSQVACYEHPMFAGLSTEFTAARYHSLAAADADLPHDLEVTARTPDGVIMALCHRTAPLWGVQFHPESVASPDGRAFLEGFLAQTNAARERTHLQHD